MEEVQTAEIMVNMTREAADQAMMRAMEGAQRAKNASARMDQLIQVSRDLQTEVIFDLSYRLKSFVPRKLSAS